MLKKAQLQLYGRSECKDGDNPASISVAINRPQKSTILLISLGIELKRNEFLLCNCIGTMPAPSVIIENWYSLVLKSIV